MGNNGAVLVLGGSGVFGSRICRRLIGSIPNPVVIAGRRRETAEARCQEIRTHHPSAEVTAMACNVDDDLDAVLMTSKAGLVVNATGPFQGQDYRVPRACIRAGVSYIDIADAREYVAKIGVLGADAHAAGVSVVAGASSVPGLSSTVVAHLARGLERLERISIGITPGNRSPRGRSTTNAILSYVGQPILVPGTVEKEKFFGWQGLRRRTLTVPNKALLKRRLFCVCDVPDLELLPAAYPGLESMRFEAGLELKTLHIGLWLCSWLVRSHVLASLAPATTPFLAIANALRSFGSDRGGMYVELAGHTKNGRSEHRFWQLIAESGCGVNVPAIPAVILARRWARGELNLHDAQPCLALFDLDEFLNEVSDLDIACHEESFVEHG